MTYRSDPSRPVRVALGLAAAVLWLQLAACSGRADADSGADPGAGGPPPAAPVDVAAAVQRSLPEVVEFTGRLEAAELVELRPRIAGAIVAVHVAAGATVRRGELLFSIDPRPYEAAVASAEAQRLTAEAQSRLAASELVRARALLPQQAISQQEVDQLAASAETAAAAVKTAEAALRSARLDLDYTAVRAPVDGRVSRIEITQGNYVNDQRVLTTLVGTRRVHAYFDAPEAVYLQLRRAPDVDRDVRMGLVDEDGYPRRGRVDFIDNRLDPATGTIELRAAFDNADGALVPGLFARIRVNVAAPSPVVLTPERAIGTDQDRKFVWVVGEGGMPEPRPVELGALVDGMRVLRSGVRAGEAVIVGGLQRVQPGLPVAPTPVPVDERGMPLPAAPAGTPPAGAAS